MAPTLAPSNSRYTLDVLRASLFGSPDVRIFFVHMPKCGGTSVSRAISRNFGYERGRFAGRGILPIDAVTTKRVGKSLEMTSAQFREYLLLYGMAHPGVRYISGHVPFSKKGYLEFGDSWDLVSILRDPVSKWFSQYFYNRYKPLEHSRPKQELEAFLQTRHAAVYGCDYVRFLASTDAEPSSEEAISAAIDNLDCFSVLGLLEDLERFVEDFRSHFGFGINLETTNRNPVSARERDNRISPEIRNEVERLCRPNQRIYEEVRCRIAS